MYYSLKSFVRNTFPKSIETVFFNSKTEPWLSFAHSQVLHLSWSDYIFLRWWQVSTRISTSCENYVVKITNTTRRTFYPEHGEEVAMWYRTRLWINNANVFQNIKRFFRYCVILFGGLEWKQWKSIDVQLLSLGYGEYKGKFWRCNRSAVLRVWSFNCQSWRTFWWIQLFTLSSVKKGSEWFAFERKRSAWQRYYIPLNTNYFLWLRQVNSEWLVPENARENVVTFLNNPDRCLIHVLPGQISALWILPGTWNLPSGHSSRAV